jgi:hypothetical protein
VDGAIHVGGLNDNRRQLGAESLSKRRTRARAPPESIIAGIVSGPVSPLGLRDAASGISASNPDSVSEPVKPPHSLDTSAPTQPAESGIVSGPVRRRQPRNAPLTDGGD